MALPSASAISWAPDSKVGWVSTHHSGTEFPGRALFFKNGSFLSPSVAPRNIQCNSQVCPLGDLLQCRHNLANLGEDIRAPCCVEDDQSDFAAREILLVGDVAIPRKHAIEPSMLSLAEQFPVAQPCPTQQRRHTDIVFDKVPSQLPRKIVIKQNAQAAAVRKRKPQARPPARSAGSSCR